MFLYLFQGESHDSGTESDGDILEVEKHRNLDLDMETSIIKRYTKENDIFNFFYFYFRCKFLC